MLDFHEGRVDVQVLRSTRRSDGFTLFEVMIVLAIMAFVVAMAVPSLNRYRLQESTRANAIVLATSLREARSRAIREGRQWFVLFNPPSGAYARVVQDMDNDFQETAGVDVAFEVNRDPGSPAGVLPYGLGPATPFPGSPRHPHDQNAGTLGGVVDGSGFLLDPVSGFDAVGFTARGIPVSLQNPTAWGGGTGAYYFSDSSQTVYSVDVGPLGAVRVRGLSAALGTWN